MSKKISRRKHIPQRTCVGCRDVNAKRSLIRIVRSESGIEIDPSGKLPGRGAYLHNQQGCWEIGLKGALEHALRARLEPEERERLAAFGRSLPKVELPDHTPGEPAE